MARIILFFIVVFFTCTSWAQSDKYTYQPFIMDGTCEWVMTADYGTNGTKIVISNEDTLILGEVYKKVYWIPCKQPDVKTYSGAIREEDKRVFFFDGRYNDDDTSDNLIYDFNLEVGDRMKCRGGRFPEERYESIVSRIDTITIEGIIRRKYFFDSVGFTWIEGIGNEHDFTRPTDIFPTCYSPVLAGVWHNGKALFCNGYKCNCGELLPISEQTFVSSFHVLQNPIRDKLLSMELIDAVFSKIDIYSWDGKLLLTKDVAIRNGVLEVPLTDLQPGNYIVILSRPDNSRESTKIIVL